MTTEELYSKLNKTYPNDKYEILDWDEVNTHPITIKCLNCGSIKTYTRIYGLFSKKKTRFCSNCSETVSQIKVRQILKNNNLEFIKWDNQIDSNGKIIFRVIFKCPECGQITNRRVWEVINSCDTCGYCGIGHRRKKSHEQFLLEVQKKFPGEYEILDQYISAKKKIKVRHLDCGFIFEITPDNLLQGRGCPRCNRYNSKGSKKIKEWLEQNHISYTTEKTFPWSNQKRYDFFVQEYNLLIEFNGIQHYQPIPFFLKNRTFKEQQESDIFKKEKAIENGYNFLVIKYDEIEKIPSLLEGSTTIPTGVDSSESKEQASKLDDNIV